MVVASLKSSVQAQTAQNAFNELLDSLIADVATEAHRAAYLGFDYRLDNEEEEEAQLCVHARATVGDVDINGTDMGGKYAVDVFGQSHPTIASEMLNCMNCGRPIVAGRFAPHLEKCMGKGRKARLKARSNMSSAQQRRGRAAPLSSTANNTGASSNRTTNKTMGRMPASTLEDSQQIVMDVNDATSEESPEDDKDILPKHPHPGKARSKTSSRKGQRATVGSAGQRASTAMVPFPSEGVVGRGSSVPDTALGSQTGLVSGMAVQVSVEAETVGSNHKTRLTGNVMQSGNPKGKRLSEKRKNMGQVLARKTSVMNSAMPAARGDGDARKSVEVRIEASDSTSMLPFRKHVW